MKKNVFALLVFPTLLWGQTNLIDSSSWQSGIATDNLSGYVNYGPTTENIIESGTDPFGASSHVWRVIPTSSSSFRGFTTITLTDQEIDLQKDYRFSVWVKKVSDEGGQLISFLKGVSGYEFIQSDGTLNRDGYFKSSGNVPNNDEWYLLVGFILGNTSANTYPEAGIYDLQNNKVSSLNPISRFNTSLPNFEINVLFYNSGGINENMFFYSPRLEEVNGQEPTILELLSGSNGSDTQPPTAPTLSSISQTDTTADLSWTGATDDTAVTAYKIYKDGTLEATLGSVSTYQVIGLTAGTTYNFTVTALDAAGNESLPSNAASVTTNSMGGGGTVWIEANSVASYTGNVAVGTTTVPAGYQMAIDGKLISEEVKVQLSGAWPDYVFAEDYTLPTLHEVERHIQEKGHLINIPSAYEVEANGIELGEMNKRLLEKIEELTLYILKMDKEIQELKNRNQHRPAE